MTAPRSERTRVIANLGWVGGLTLVALGAALLVSPEAPLVAGTLSVVSGTGMALAGTLVLRRTRPSWTVAIAAFAFAAAVAAYVAWIAAPYWRAAAVAGGLALCGLLAHWHRRRMSPVPQRSGLTWGDPT